MELQSKIHHGRPLADDELRHALVEYSGDLTADNGAVPSLSPTPTFFGHPVLIDYPPGLRNAHAVHRAICATVAQAEGGHAKVAQLVAGIREAVATYGCTARVIGRTPGVIEFTVTRD